MATIRYDRDTLISIGLQSTCQLTPDPQWPTEIQRQDPRRRKKYRGKRAGVKSWLTTLPRGAQLPIILLTNVQSLESSLQDLRAMEKFQKDIQSCSLLCFTETRLSPAVPDHEIQPNELFSVHRMDTAAELGRLWGGGLCLMVNRKWCDSDNIAPLAQFYSHNLKLLSIRCGPRSLPQHFTSVIVSAVCVPVQANSDTALLELHWALSQLQAQHPDSALIVAGDFRGANLKRTMPHLHQHVSSPCKGQRCYTPFRDAYKSQPYRPYGIYVPAATFLVPTDTQQGAPIHSEVTPWFGQSVSVLQDAVDTAHREMFNSGAGCLYKEPFRLLRI